MITPPTLGDFSTTPKSQKGKAITHPTKFLHIVHMEIGCDNCVAQDGYQYILTFVDRETHKVWNYGMRDLSGSDII